MNNADKPIQKLNFRMLMPFDSNRPVAPLNYLQWLFNADGYEETLIRIISKFHFEEHDKFAYIWIDDEPKIRFDIEENIIYARESNYSETETMETVEQIMNFFERIKCRAIIEKAHNCTYGL